MLEITVGIVFGGWLALTLYKNLPHRLRAIGWVNRITGLWLIPSWTFFAPTPGTKCYHILYRDWTVDGCGSWRHLPLAAHHHRRLRALWNPEKTENKVLIDIANDFATILNALNSDELRHPPRRLQVTLPYLTVLALVSTIPRLGAVVATQFAIGQTGPADAGILLVSAPHRL